MANRRVDGRAIFKHQPNLNKKGNIMQFRKVVLASFLALSLVACGDSDDNKDKPDDNPKIPEKSEACVAAGDRCQLVDGEWKITEEKPKDDDNVPTVDSSFDYSDIGVTDALKPEKRGFGFYHKGEGSPLDEKNFEETVTLAPTIPWTSSLNYDVDLFNFVAIRLHDGEKSSKGKTKYMFDKIGVENQKATANQNVAFFGNYAHDQSAWGVVGQSSFKQDASAPQYQWNIVPALVNTFMYRDASGFVKYFPDATNRIWFNQEEDVTSKLPGGGRGNIPLRVYGHNAFLDVQSNADKFLIEYGKKNSGTDEEMYALKNRPNSWAKVPKHVNFAWWKPSNRFAKAIEDPDNTGKVLPAHKQYDGVNKKFPTDHELGVLKATQFGRLTGQGVNPDASPISGYNDKKLKPYPFISDDHSIAAAGGVKAEDWYFARGTTPTPLSVLDNYKEAGNKVVYDGQAVMFGLDYNPETVVVLKKDDETPADDKSTNSVMPKSDVVADNEKVLENTLLDGKQNFVRVVWDPASGHINGEVFGVWTMVQYWRALQDNAGSSPSVEANQVIALKVGANGIIEPDYEHPATNGGIKFIPSDPKDLDKYPGLENVVWRATKIDAFKKTLVELKGKVVEGTNSFGGEAIRFRDKDKGMFMGGFFGPTGDEIGGVINSQMGNMKNKELTDPANKWGGAFGAQIQAEAMDTLEYLDFPDDLEFNYDTATEVF